MTVPLARPLLIFAAGAWLVATGYGFRELIRFDDAPGEDSAAPSLWPAASALHRGDSRGTLVMVVHPQCSCSRASVGELALIMAHAQGLADAYVLFFKPAGFPRAWAENDLWRSASAIPGVQVRIDNDGKDAKLFHASTSGAVMLYDRAGRLIFEGGITPSRSHSGDNAGRTAIVSLLSGGRAGRSRTFVFGCSILDSRLPGALSP